MAANNTPNATSVCWARLTAGVRNWGTALAIASTPASEEHPSANALRSGDQRNPGQRHAQQVMGHRRKDAAQSGCPGRQTDRNGQHVVDD